jgi:hypothetical protein
VSRTRRRAAAYRHACEIETKAGNRQVARNLTERHPLELLTPRSGLPWRGAYALIQGEWYDERDASGNLVWSIQAPDYVVPYGSWARAVWVRPRPLPRSLRSKLRRHR